jgi:hypothetical protein
MPAQEGHMHTTRSSLLVLAAALAVASLSGCFGDGGPSASNEAGLTSPWCPHCIDHFVTVGPLDLVEYCHRNYAARSKPVLVNSNDPSSWKCQLDKYQLDLVLDRGCTEQYGAGSNSQNLTTDPNGWRCTKPDVDHCAVPNGSEYVTVKSLAPVGIASANGYEVYGEPSLWNLTVHANQFTPQPDPNPSLVLPLSWGGRSFDFLAANNFDATFSLATDPITTASPASNALGIGLPCGPITMNTPPLTRVNPTRAPVPGIGASATYVNPNQQVTLNLSIDPSKNTPTTCISNSRVRLVGKQSYDNAIVVDATYDSNFYSKMVTVKPAISTVYTVTTYCNLNKTLSNSASVTVTVFGGEYKCADGHPKPQYWFCRDCPYNAPPLTNTLVATACTYDEAQQIAWSTSFGGACNIADGKCPSCPNPDDCGN